MPLHQLCSSHLSQAVVLHAMHGVCVKRVVCGLLIACVSVGKSAGARVQRQRWAKNTNFFAGVAVRRHVYSYLEPSYTAVVAFVTDMSVSASYSDS